MPLSKKAPLISEKVLSRMWWPKWRLVSEHFGSPEQIDTWTLFEVLQANEMLDIKYYVDFKSAEAARGKR